MKQESKLTYHWLNIAKNQSSNEGKEKKRTPYNESMVPRKDASVQAG
jgi:hypothetical protein